MVDDLDFVVAFQRCRQPPADIAAARDHDFLDRAVYAAQFAHHRLNVLFFGEEEHFIARLDDGMALGHDAAIPAENRRDPAIQVGHVLSNHLQFVSDQRSAVIGTHRHQAHAAIGKIEHLQRLGMLDQAVQIMGDFLLRADGMVDGEVPAREGFPVILVLGDIIRRTQARNARRHIEFARAQLAGNQVGLVALGDRNHHVRILHPRLFQYRRMGCVSLHGAQVEAVLQQSEPLAVHVDDSEIVVLCDQACRQGAADLAGAQDDDFHLLVKGEGGRGIRGGADCGRDFGKRREALSLNPDP